MRLIHLLNAFLWAANAALWFGYAHSAVMGFASILAAVGSFWLSRNES